MWSGCLFRLLVRLAISCLLLADPRCLGCNKELLNTVEFDCRSDGHCARLSALSRLKLGGGGSPIPPFRRCHPEEHKCVECLTDDDCNDGSGGNGGGGDGGDYYDGEGSPAECGYDGWCEVVDGEGGNRTCHTWRDCRRNHSCFLGACDPSLSCSGDSDSECPPSHLYCLSDDYYDDYGGGYFDDDGAEDDGADGEELPLAVAHRVTERRSEEASSARHPVAGGKMCSNPVTVAH